MQVILYCELEESEFSTTDSFYYFYVKYSNNLIRDMKKSSGTCSDLHEILDVVDCEVLVFTRFSYNILESRLIEIENLHFKLYSLSSFLCLPQNIGLYEIFSYYFDSGNEVLTDTSMLGSIVTSVLTCNTNIQYTYCAVFLRENLYSFAWFCVDESSSLTILGYDTLSLPQTSSKSFVLGKFMKSLRYKMAVSGCCLARTKFIAWDEDCITSDISKYILEYKTFKDLFSTVSHLASLEYNEVVHLLSTNLRYSYDFSANDFISALSQSSKLLRLESLDDGSLICTNIFQKDYSICASTLIDKTRCKWGIILDCEGNKENKSGLRELGGIIFCRYNNILLSVETFECTEVLLEETIQQTIKNYEEGTGRYIPSRGIDVLTFGGTDEFMIEDSLRSVSSKQFRRKIKKMFKYHDCRDYIYGYLSDKHIKMDDRKTLSNIAKELGVCVVTPKHSALADSRTLFNVLAFILQDSNYWVLDV